MAKWSTAFINDLPDSSFAYIEKGGKKDSAGKTTPRELRHLPYKDENGDVDHNHTENALSRLDQTDGIPASEKAAVRTKLENALQKVNKNSADFDMSERLTMSASAIKLDANGQLPTRMPLLTTFNHPNGIKGNFSVDTEDLKQIKENFDAGIGFPTEDASTGLAIDFEHKWLEKAAAWIKGLELQIDPNDESKATLFANPVEWTDEGAEAVQNGRYKMISPMGSFGKKNGKLSLWSNVNNLKEKLANVLEGAGLTNAPYQRGMPPVRADRSDDLHSGNDNVIYVYDVQPKREQSMNLAALRVKDRDELSVPELDYLEEHREELSASERTKFKLDASAENDNRDQLSQEDKDLLAAVKSGEKKIVDGTAEAVSKDSLSRMESTIERYRKQEVADLLDKHVKRGAIKADSAKLDGFWGKQLLAAATEEELSSVKEALDALPSNEQLAQEMGTGENVVAGSTAREQLDRLAKEKVEKAAKDGKTLLYADALKQVYRENNDLRTQDAQESKARASVLTAAGA